jgi:hypothetical protein
MGDARQGNRKGKWEEPRDIFRQRGVGSRFKKAGVLEGKSGISAADLESIAADLHDMGPDGDVHIGDADE